MKRILVLTNSDHAYQGAGGRTRIVSEINVLHQMPVTILLLCIVPFKKFIHLAKIRAAGKKLSADANTPTYYIPSIPTSHFIFLAKCSHFINAVFILGFSKLKWINIIHAHGNVIAYSAIVAKKMGNKAVVITDAHGCVAHEYAYATPRFSKKWMNWLEEMEEKVMRFSDKIIFVSESMQHFYSKKFGGQYRNATIVACAANPIQMIPVSQREAKRKELNINNKIVFVYLGSFRKYQMVNETLAVFKEIKQKVDNAFLLILTSHRAEFSAALQSLGVNKADYFMMGANQTEVPDILCAADIGFLLRDQSVVNEVASPTKFAEYLMCGIPVILTKNIGDYSGFTMEHSTGFVLNDFHASDELIQFVKEVDTNRMHYYNHCYHKAISLLSWNFAGKTLKELYA